MDKLEQLLVKCDSIDMGRKRDLKNVHAKRPPKFNPEDPEDLNDWGAELEQMTKRRREHNERHQPKP